MTRIQQNEDDSGDSNSERNTTTSHEEETTKMMIRVLEAIQQRSSAAERAAAIDWDDRIHLQNQWTLVEKGWSVQVAWKCTKEYGVGLFAAEDIAAETVMRRGIFGYNLFPVKNVKDIERFCRGGIEYDDESTTTTSSDDDAEYQARLRYVSDYLWGFDPQTADDARGYPSSSTGSSDSRRSSSSTSTTEDWFFGFWIPGNSLNHDSDPNMVYRPSWTTTTTLLSEDGRTGTGTTNSRSCLAGINVVALRDIAQGEAIFDDYRRHGAAPPWLRDFARDKSNMPLNFADCNDFVNVSTQSRCNPKKRKDDDDDDAKCR
jgi:SET domain